MKKILLILGIGLFATALLCAGLFNKDKKKKKKTSVAGVRGVEEDTSTTTAHHKDYGGLAWLEEFEISEREVQKFIKQGNLYE